MRLWHKLRARRGVCLTELLAATLVLALVALAAAVGVSSALQAYRQSVMASEAQMLSSTLSIALMDELRYGRDFQYDGTGQLTAYTSGTFGGNTTLSTLDGTEKDTGILRVGGGLLIPEATYHGLFAQVTVTKSGQALAVELTIQEPKAEPDTPENAEENKDITTVQFSLEPLNGA